MCIHPFKLRFLYFGDRCQEVISLRDPNTFKIQILIVVVSTDESRYSTDKTEVNKIYFGGIQSSGVIPSGAQRLLALCLAVSPGSVQVTICGAIILSWLCAVHF